MQRIRRSLSYANVMATIAVFIALGGSSYAAVTLSRNSVSSKHLRNNAVTSQKVKDFSLRTRDFAAGQLPAGARGPAGRQGAQGPSGPQGAQGPAGSQGAKGDAGEPATRLWAAVEGGAAGTILRGSGAQYVEKFGGPGQYRVVFNRDVKDCTWLATPGDPTTDGGWSTVTGKAVATSTYSGDVTGAVRVETGTGGGALENGGFFLAVFC